MIDSELKEISPESIRILLNESNEVFCNVVDAVTCYSGKYGKHDYYKFGPTIIYIHKAGFTFVFNDHIRCDFYL